ncbi:hypothetical protein RM590_35245 [Streptomyces sp. DSM 44938]|uniref:Uncharacterized protein n=1 Tax=Streptomyces litchfieldiae TaxID=3075543 RepID=A0ABU2N1H6_9ACTN|nr:hypothetical protein [Streptomyces sp. DSM 44938]
MEPEEEHYNLPLAEILLSNNVGVAHIRLVGDLISVKAQLSIGMREMPSLALDQRADIATEILKLEEEYRLAWESVVAAGPDIEELKARLVILENALRGAVRGVVESARRNGIHVANLSLE